MSAEFQILLSNINAESADSSFAYSEKKTAAGYHRKSHALHTAIYSVDSFVGVIKLQATLALYPGEYDWFDIDDTSIGMSADSTVWPANSTLNFSGNFVWIRAAYNLQNGTIIVVRYSY